MTELFITSSVLILVIVTLRHFLKGKISLRLQYALWALVLIRLLVPASPLKSPVSVMNAVEKTVSTQGEWTPEAVPALVPAAPPAIGKADNKPADLIVQFETDAVTDVYLNSFDWSMLLRTIWIVGIGAVGLSLILSNLSFGGKLRKTRLKIQADDCRLPVYVVEALPSSCLFGLIRPAIYITPDVAEDAEKLRHVLAHEQTHYRHGDHIWSALRIVCLTLHWYNPLVWLAAALSRRDAELACDEAAIKSLGEENRTAYGRTLIGLTSAKCGALDFMCCATTMTDGKKGIRERITLIAQKPKRIVSALITLLLVSALAVGCTFTGAQRGEEEIIPLTAEEIERYNKEFDQILFDEEGSPYLNPVCHFFSSYYDRPEDINLSEFIRYFPSEDVTDQNEFEALKAHEYWPHGPDVTLDTMPVPIHRISAEKVNEALKKYMGITLKDLSGVGTKGLEYLKKYDAYYNYTSDAGAGFFVCVSGERQGDIVRLYSKTGTLTLKLKGDGYLFVSHQRPEESGVAPDSTVSVPDIQVAETNTPDIAVRTLGKVADIYTLEQEPGHTAVRTIAELLTAQLLGDLKTAQDGRTFTITDWKNLSVTADRIYNVWVVTGSVDVRYEGILSPVDSNEHIPEGEYVNVSLGERQLAFDNGVYTLSLRSVGNQKAILEPPLLTPDMTVGIGIIPDYADEEILIFHGYFGLFVYDLRADKITFAADLEKAVGTTIIQGSEGAAVRVSADGRTVQLYFYPEQGEPIMAYSIDPRTGSYTYDYYAPQNTYAAIADELYSRFTGGTLGELTYTDGKTSLPLFEGWDWAE